jgi:hypothetical protein
MGLLSQLNRLGKRLEKTLGKGCGEDKRILLVRAEWKDWRGACASARAALGLVLVVLDLFVELPIGEK